ESEDACYTGVRILFSYDHNCSRRNTLRGITGSGYKFRNLLNQTMEVTCARQREPVTVKQNCNSDEICIEYADEQNEIFAVCTSRVHVRQWSTENSDNIPIFTSCSPNEPYKTGGGKNLTLGITTYAKNNVTNQEEKH
ncbi:22726_t:CDS:2, partial [Racocetra persica]